jgi:glycosyltransferase involved in cell wall biosynthesis
VPRPPLVTVLMAVHNDIRYLPDAVDSILRQSFEDFEFVVVDDGCSDGTSEYLATLNDDRIRVLRNSSNVGLTRSLNIGLDRCRGAYVARMDADDVAETDRLARQVEFLERNSEVGLLGTSRTLIDEHGDKIAKPQAAVGLAPVLWKMLLGNAFAHPTVMLRREVLERHSLRYDETFQTAQDYELWVRMLQVAQGDNLADPLLRYRLREGITRTRKAEQLANHDWIAHAAIRTFLPELNLSVDDVTQLRSRFGGFSVRDPSLDPHDPYWQHVHAKMRAAFERRYGAVPTAVAA